MLYVGSADSAVVAKHHPNGTKLALLQVDGGPQHRAGWLALNKAETRLLSTSRSASLHQFDLVAKKPLASAQAAPDDAACFALQPLPDGKGVLIACKTCVHRLGPNGLVVDSFCPVGAPDGAAAAAANSSAPAGDGAEDEVTGLKTLSLDPAGTHFYGESACATLAAACLEHAHQDALPSLRRSPAWPVPCLRPSLSNHGNHHHRPRAPSLSLPPPPRAQWPTRARRVSTRWR